MNITRVAVWITAIVGWYTPALVAQAPFPFQLRVRQDSNVFTIANNTTITLETDGAGIPASVRVTILYQGRTQATLPSAPQLLGSNAFTFTPLGEPPITLQPNQTVEFTLTYTPANSSPARAQLIIPFVEAPQSNDLPATAGTINFGLAGGAPEVTVSYALQTDANVIPVNSGGKIVFPSTLVNGVATANIILSNRGSGQATINSIQLTGDNFQPLGLPLLPGNLASGGTFTFAVRYLPRQTGTHSGEMRIDIGGKIFSATIEGSATSSTLSYETIENGTARQVLPNQEIALMETAVGQQTSVLVEVRNIGNAEGTVGVISVSGAGFTLADLPFLPAPLAPNSVLSFTLVFAPAQPGRATGRLRIGNDVFSLSSNGIGARLTFSYSAGATDIALQTGGQVLFSPVQVGKSASAVFTVRNEGTSSATIATIGLADLHDIFRIERMPVLPLVLQPEESTTFNLIFAPAQTGQLITSLLVHSQSFSISGFGTPPDPIPGFRFSGATGTMQPLEQPAIGLTLDAPYPLPLRGVVTMTTESELFAPDPAVQFIAGGRQIAFSIPASATEAVFANGASSARFQTGTVAATISFAATFATSAGLDLTPPNAPSHRIAIPPLAPTLLSVQVAGQSADSVVLLVTGFATNRALSRLDFTFTGASDVNLSGSQASVNVEPEALVWFRNPASQAFGGQFSITMPFTFRGQLTDQTPLIDKVRNVSVTATSGLGTSRAVTANIR
jgi:hypothetical protein